MENEPEFILAVRQKNIDQIKNLLKTNDKNILNNTNELGYTALHISIMFDYNDISELLLKNSQIDVNTITTNEVTPLRTACEKRNMYVLKLLLKRSDLDINYKFRDSDITAFMIAIFVQNVEMVKLFLDRDDLDINKLVNRFEYYNIQGKPTSYLSFAIMNLSPKEDEDFYDIDRSEIVQMIIQRKDVDINIKSAINGYTPLHYAVIYDTLQAVLTLIKNKNVNVNEKDNNNRTALQYLFHNLFLGETNPDTIDVETCQTVLNFFLSRSDLDISSFPTMYPININDENPPRSSLKLLKICKQIDTIKKNITKKIIEEKTASEISRRVEENKRKRETTESKEIETCPICLETNSDTDNPCIRLRTCGHSIHKSCLLDLLNSKKSQTIDYYNAIEHHLPYDPSRQIGGAVRCPQCKTPLLEYSTYDSSNYLEYYNSVQNIINMLDGTIYKRKIKNKSINRSRRIKNKSINRSRRIKNKSINRSRRIKNKSINRSRRIKNKSINRSRRVKNKSINRSRRIKNKSINRSRRIKNKSTRRNRK